MSGDSPESHFACCHALLSQVGDSVRLRFAKPSGLLKEGDVGVVALLSDTMERGAAETDPKLGSSGGRRWLRLRPAEGHFGRALRLLRHMEMLSYDTRSITAAYTTCCSRCAE